MDASNPMVQRQVMEGQLKYMVGKEFVIRFLSSEKGQLLNERKCTVTGFSGDRLQVQLRDDGSTFNLKMRNLLPIENFMTMANQGTLIPDQEVLKLLEKECKHHERAAGKGDRQDMKARIDFIRGHLNAGIVPSVTGCMDPLVPASELNDFMSFMLELRPCCSGDNTVDFRHFNAGLVGNDNACAVCLEGLDSKSKVLGFPCGHLFHNKCASGWLEKNNTCPTCRFKLGMPGREYAYMFDYEDRLGTRLREWFISGMCERCQALIHEADPLCCLPGPKPGSTLLVPRSQLEGNEVDGYWARE